MQLNTLIPTLSIHVEDLLRVQGADADQVRVRRPAVYQLAQEAVQHGSRLIRPQVWIETLRVTGFQHDQFQLESGHTLRGAFIAHKLAGSKSIVAGVGTLGAALEAEISAQMPLDPLWGYMLDSYGTAAADALAEGCLAQVRAQAETDGMGASMALLPGHTGWPVDVGQPQVFAIVKPDPDRVRLTESCQMIPRKSFSFVIGLGCPTDAASPCEICDLRATCPLRRE